MSFVKKRHQRHKTYNQERWKRTRKRTTMLLWDAWASLRGWLWVLLGCCGVVLAELFLFSPLLHVREIRVQRSDTYVDISAIQQALRPFFDRHLLFVTTQEITDVVRSAVPDVAGVTVGRNYPSQLVVRIRLQPLTTKLLFVEEQPPQPVAASGALAESGTGVSADVDTGALVPLFEYMTASGVYVPLPYAASGAQLITIEVHDWSERPVANTQAIPSSLLARMQDAERILQQEFNKKVTRRSVLLRSREFHLSLGPVALWFDMRTSLAEQLERYRTFLKSVPEKDVRQYVDLRLAGRIVYK